ncbi:MAG TPA: polynucleotide adenylyltransferase [Candidatus Angelobacter sp.]|nr:polynucleotide adenylyltransferase [Candidatus Angelobacter sp.]
MNLPDELVRLLRDVPALSRAYLVGGCVRDSLLGIVHKDFDLEVYGVGYEALERVLSAHGRVDLVGKSFGVIKFTSQSGAQWDFSLPRRDSKMSAGHKGFRVEFDPGIDPKTAASRRDFTINALMFDPRTGEYLDFFGGRDDLEKRVLRHTSSAFVEDPLRVLRGMQFAARFDLTLAPETVGLCRSIVQTFPELAVERVGMEWFKWAGASRRPSAGLRFLKDTGWLRHFPEIAALDGTPQDPEWHPEGDVFTHTCHCCDAMAELPEWRAADETTRRVLMFAVLAHDFAKPQTTQEVERDGQKRIVSPGHEEQGGPVAEAFLTRIGAPNEIKERVVPLVKHHLAHLQMVSNRSVRRLANCLKPASIDELCLVMTADHFGRPPKPRIIHEGISGLRTKAEELRLRDAAPKPLLQGRHLIARGMQPGAQFGRLLDEAFEAQLEGRFTDLDGALKWLDERN